MVWCRVQIIKLFKEGYQLKYTDTLLKVKGVDNRVRSKDNMSDKLRNFDRFEIGNYYVYTGEKNLIG